MLQLERRRSNIEVMADILRLGESSKTEIMYAVNLSYAQLVKYIDLLLKLKLLNKSTASSQSVNYRVTPKGLRLLRKIDIVLDILEGQEEIDLSYKHYITEAKNKELSTL